MIELLTARAQAVFDIAQALPKGELGERHAQQLVPAGEPRGLILTTILRDNPAKLAVGNKVDDLGKYEASDVHNIGTLQKTATVEGALSQAVVPPLLAKVIFQSN